MRPRTVRVGLWQSSSRRRGSSSSSSPESGPDHPDSPVGGSSSIAGYAAAVRSSSASADARPNPSFAARTPLAGTTLAEGPAAPPTGPPLPQNPARTTGAAPRQCHHQAHSPLGQIRLLLPTPTRPWGQTRRRWKCRRPPSQPLALWRAPMSPPNLTPVCPMPLTEAQQLHLSHVAVAATLSQRATTQSESQAGRRGGGHDNPYY
jgi:hypothetical protein